jgi:hypothetical protein
MRDDVVSDAVRFLADPAVAASPRHRQEEFLKGKGLDDDEIRAAFGKAGQGSPPPPPVPPSPSVAPARRVRNWLFLLLLGLGSAFFYYRRIVKVPESLCFRGLTI